MKLLSKHIFLAFAIHWSILGISQDSSRLYSRWDLQPALGFNFSNSTLKTGEITDFLVDYNFNNFYLQGLSGTFYLFRHFGVELTMQASYGAIEKQQAEGFQYTLESIYGDNYFVDSERDIPTSYNGLTGEFPTYYYGLVFRIQKNRLQWKAKLMLSSITINKSSGSVTLKEKGTNNVLELIYHTSSDSPPETIISPSLYIAYRIYERFLFHVNFIYSHTDINFSYTEKIKDLATDQSQSRVIPYSTVMRKYSVGIGATIEFGTIKPKKSPTSP